MWYLDLQSGKRQLYLKDAYMGQFSPDGHFVAYAVNRPSDVSELYVQPFPDASRGKWKIGDGIWPRWRRDGKELFYVSTDWKMMAVEVNTSPAFKIGTPKLLFTVQNPAFAVYRGIANYDVTPDGKKFLIDTFAGHNTQMSPPITVLLNWEKVLHRNSSAAATRNQ